MSFPVLAKYSFNQALFFTTLAALGAFAVPAAAAGGAEQPASYNWNGLYGGVTLGDSQGNSRRDFSPPQNTTTGNFSTDGIIGGGTFGYNRQINAVVIGAEGDFSGSGLSGGANCPNTAYKCEVYSDWLATLRPRIGYAFGQIMPYATGGLAVGDVHSHSQAYATGRRGTDFDNAEPGWTAGGGVEFGLLSNLSFKAEYLYVKLANSDGPSNIGNPTTAHFDENIERIGVNFRFD